MTVDQRASKATIVFQQFIPKDWRWLVKLGAVFVAGLLLMVYGPGASPALGAFIVIPTALTLLMLAWGSVLYWLVRLCGGDPRQQDGFGLWVFLSFAFILALFSAWWHRR